jgi:hypothetical protein
MDVSHHVTLNYDEVKKHVDGFILRTHFGTTKDMLFEKHYLGLREKPIAGFQWFRPDLAVVDQVEAVKITCDYKPEIKVFFSDIEQQGVYGVGTSIYSPEYLSTKAQQHVEGLKLHGFDVGVYTAAWWMNAYCGEMAKWMYDYQVWLASWPFAKGAVTLSWEYLMSNWAPKMFLPSKPNAVTDEQYKSTDAWQWSGDKFILPGVYTNQPVPVPRTCDLNYVSDALFERFTTGVVIPPVPATEPIVEKMRNELFDLESSMITNKLEVDERLAKDIKELHAIRGMLP